jgi:hypothetical protein
LNCVFIDMASAELKLLPGKKGRLQTGRINEGRYVTEVRSTTFTVIYVPFLFCFESADIEFCCVGVMPRSPCSWQAVLPVFCMSWPLFSTPV